MASHARKTKGTPDPIDVHVGQRLRVRRSLLGLSQEKLAESIGLTFQQIQKYERGMNRISAGRLYQFSKILEVPVTYFYDQLGNAAKAYSSSTYGLADNDQEEFAAGDLMQNKETLDLVRAFYTIDNPEIRKDILKFVKSMANRMGGEGESE
jgi:transcriptional regulator with XRE-family HTH domain